MNSLIDTYTPRGGIFKLDIFDAQKNLIDTYQDNNLIVYSGRTAVRDILTSTSLGVDGCITKVGVGTRDTETDPEDSDLEEKTYGILLDITYPDNLSATFVWELGYGEGNGREIKEYGLFTNNEKLFARKVRPSISKDIHIMLRGSWTILF